MGCNNGKIVGFVCLICDFIYHLAGFKSVNITWVIILWLVANVYFMYTNRQQQTNCNKMATTKTTTKPATATAEE